jgi:flagellin
MANSVNTNYGATIALQSFNRTNRELSTVQKRVSTGFRVADAKDDGAAFAVAQGLRADMKGNEAVSERLASAKGLLSVTQEALKGISDTVGKIHAVVVKMYDVALSDLTLSSDEYAQYAADYDALREDIKKYVSQASFGGKNLLDGTNPDGLNIISDASGGVIKLGVKTAPYGGAGITIFDIRDELDNTFWPSANILDYNDISSWLFPTPNGMGSSNYDVFTGLIDAHIAAVGQDIRTVENQNNFIKIQNDAIANALGSIVDADLAKESARLQALQIRQQLGTQTLSIANQSPSMLISLFQ